MTVHTSCLHTNQHWCLLSALILVNTDVYVRKRSDRCMIEVLKSRHSQRLFSSPHFPESLWFSSCVSILTSYASALFHLLPHFCIFFLSCLINVTHLLQALVLNVRQLITGRISCVFFNKRRPSLSRDPGRSCLILSGRHWFHMDFATFSKTLHYKRVCLNEICKR